MLKERLLEMALKVAVDLLNKQNPNATSPVRMAFDAVLKAQASESDIALIKYCFEHPGA